MSSRDRALRAPQAALIESVEPRTLFATVPAGFTTTVLASGLTSPTAIDVAPDGRAFFSDQSGHIRIIAKNTLVAAPFADLSAQVDSTSERGLMGLVLDPNFSSNGYLYIFYTVNGATSHNRVSRLTVDPADPFKMLANSEVDLIDLPDLTPTSIWHMGGALQFGADGKLYICVGDQLEKDKAQDPASVLGKVLRINSDGTIPTDNPYYDINSGNNRAIWASGLRNPYTSAIDPVTGRFFINDVGQATAEEINDGVAGANYGWSTTEGTFDQATYPNFTEPFYAYGHVNGRQAITAGTFYHPPVATFGQQYAGQYFFADFGTGELLTIDPTTKALGTFGTGFSYPVGLHTGPDGAVYMLARGAGAGGATGEGLGQVLKIQANSALLGPLTSYATGTNSHSVANADLNGDGKLDLAVANAGSDSVSVLFGNGDGTFQPATNYGVGNEPKAVMAADLNGDGKIDLATCSQGDSKISILINNGDGTYKSAVNYNGTTGSHELALADLDGDGDLDIAQCGWGASLVRTLFNNGSGVFGGAKDYAVGSAPHSVVAEDFNGDGRIDLAVADLSSSNLAVLTNKGGGAFNSAKFYATGSAPHSVRAADFNRDGKMDLVAACQSSNALSVLLGNGDGTFKTKVNYAVGPVPKGVAIGDLNNDGFLDLVAANTANNYPSGSDPAGMTISVLFGRGDGTFGPQTVFNTGDTPFCVTLGDFDGDGDLDAATANWHSNDVTILKNFTFTNGQLPPPPPPQLGSLAGFCFNDTNVNGAYDAGETKTGGKTVFLDGNNNGKLDAGERSMVTDAGGNFSFANLLAGTYHVRRVFPSGYTYSTAAIDITLGDGQIVTNLAIGSKPTTAQPPPPPSTGTISGFAFNDTNKNGKYDTGEQKTSGKTIFLDTNNNGKLDAGEKSIVTNSSGAFSFTGLIAGTYHVRRVFPSGYTYSTSLVDIVLSAGQTFSNVAIGSKPIG
jgi:glucose/arabinose dehydrogenase